MKVVTHLALAGSILVAGTAQAAVTEQAVVKHYGEIAHAVFSDALITAEALQSKIDMLISKPSGATLDSARAAWKQARVPYQQSEVFRFGNSVVDDWEGQLNAWPLDEGLIDYVASSNYHHEMGNVGATANIIANSTLKLGGTTLDLSNITPELLASLNELGGSEANVATGYHAIEFLLWGQDLNGTKAGAGERPFTDYVQGDGCTNGNCDRRAAYLKAVTTLLVTDLKYMQGQWAAEADNYRAELESQKPQLGLTKALFGMGSLALGELAGERMKVALEANSTEDEHDCFSDNTHFSHFYDAKGIENVYYGTYKRVDGSTIKGASIAQLVAAKDPKLAAAIDQQFKLSMSAMQALVDSAEANGGGMKFDQMIAEGNAKGATLIQDAIGGLVALTRKIESAAMALGVENLSPDNADHDF
ncbi:imelysin family protein [Ketobacter alkanivorans]|uniref:Peptidase n=1 Tax=Ketobacter alkanivorans TaxID=1917421 RepID=A0A2K9LG64_9GAMM|nr:imelysin family protein [Ketobacter alkanivorans]AUM11339.1 peptidase [Ketobacter alkanivorans]